MKNADIIIVGSGVLGYSTALALLEKDSTLNIVLIGHKNKKGAATLAAGAMLGCYGEITETHLKSAHGKMKLDCSIEAKNRWKNWLRLVNERSNQNIKINKGTFIINNIMSGNIDSKNFRAIKETLTANNEEFHEVNFEDIPGINTIENQRALQSIFIPEEGNICATAFLDALDLAACSYERFSHIDDEVVKLNLCNDKIQDIRLSSGIKMEAPLIILAAGAFTQSLLDQIPDLATRIPRILSGVGHSLLLSQNVNPIKHVIRTPNRAGACGLHVLPYQEHLYVGATNEISINPESNITVGWVHFLLECILEQINQHLFSSKILEIKVGNRPSPMDGFPLIGYTSIQNLYLLTGTYRDGFHQSPYLSELVAENIICKTPVLNDLFKPERSHIQTMTREEAINEAVEHHMASAYEAGAKLPPAFWDVALVRYLKNDIKEIYELLGSHINLLPEHTLMLREKRSNETIIQFFKKYFAKTRSQEKVSQDVLTQIAI